MCTMECEKCTCRRVEWLIKRRIDQTEPANRAIWPETSERLSHILPQCDHHCNCSPHHLMILIVLILTIATAKILTKNATYLLLKSRSRQLYQREIRGISTGGHCYKNVCVCVFQFIPKLNYNMNAMSQSSNHAMCKRAFLMKKTFNTSQNM